jgi:uncharacterized protein (DUF302 family)
MSHRLDYSRLIAYFSVCDASPEPGRRITTKGKTDMAYTIDRLIDSPDIDAVDARTRAALAAHGFGVLTEIDVQATMKKKIDADMDGYRILGACNPQMAYQAIGMEPRIGAMLPCNVILREVDGAIQVSAVDPVASMQAVENDELHAVAGQVRELLSTIVDEI